MWHLNAFTEFMKKERFLSMWGSNAVKFLWVKLEVRQTNDFAAI